MSDLGKIGLVVPVTVLAARAAQIGTVSVAGNHPADFPIHGDDCSGKSVAGGGQCEVRVGFTPTAAGTRTATLRIPDSTGRAQGVPLQGFAYGGRTRLVLNSDPDDWIGLGGSYSYTPANALFNAWGTREGVGFHVKPASGGYWYGTFSPAPGGSLAPGRYTGATRDMTSRSGPGIEVTGNSRGCNTIDGEFTIHEATFDEDGKLSTIALDFVQRCRSTSEPETTAALRGTWDLRAGASTPPAPWMDGGSGSTGPPADPGPGGGTPNPAPDAPFTTPPPSAERPKSGACALRRFASLPLLKGTPAADWMRGTRAAEILFTGRGNDVLRAGGGNDCVDGGYHRDMLSGGAGNDYLSGESGNDRLDGGSGRDFLNCGAGRDVAVATPGDRTKSCERVVRPRRS